MTGRSCTNEKSRSVYFYKNGQPSWKFKDIIVPHVYVRFMTLIENFFQAAMSKIGLHTLFLS